MDSGTIHLIEMLSKRVLELANQGEWDEAIRSVDEAIERARESDGTVYQLAATVEVKADLLRQQGDLDGAMQGYIESLDLLNDSTEHAEMLGRINASVGVLYDKVEGDEEAIHYYEKSIAMYELVDPPMLPEIADICNNLGFIYRSLGDMDTAETLFIRGLEICHNELGAQHEKTAILYNNVGALYLKSGYDEQAKEMHSLALEARKVTLGENHPDTAQSYSNLALSLAQIGDKKAARDYFKRALSIYEKHIKSDWEDYAVVAENFAEFLRSISEEKASANLMKKAQKKLDKLGR